MGLFNRRAAFGLVAVVVTLALAACGGGSGPAPAKGDMKLGSPTAKVKMIEYGSLSCPHCANWNRDVFPAFKAKYIDTGKVEYTFRPFKLRDSDTYTAAGDLLGRCVGKDKYFSVIEALFHSQVEALAPGGDALGVLISVGGQAGLSEDQVRACIGDEKALIDLNERLQDPQAKTVQATPTFFIGTQKFESELPLEDIDKAYATELAKAK